MPTKDKTGRRRIGKRRNLEEDEVWREMNDVSDDDAVGGGEESDGERPEESANGGKEAKMDVYFADAESMIDPVSGKHKANLFVVQHSEGQEEYIYRGTSCLEQFIGDCIKPDSPFRNSYVVQHNGAGLLLLWLPVYFSNFEATTIC